VAFPMSRSERLSDVPVPKTGERCTSSAITNCRGSSGNSRRLSFNFLGNVTREERSYSRPCVPMHDIPLLSLH
jgi:hypothetical protein